MLAMFIAPTTVNAQQRNMTIVTNNPDFSVKVKRCAASGKTIIVDLVLENLGTNDVKIEFFELNGAGAIDDQGNSYGIAYKFANARSYEGRSYDNILIPEVPTKLSVKIEGVPADVESIVRLQLDARCQTWGIDGKPVTIRNIPITRQ